MLLTIADGTTTIDLSGTAPVRGCTYFPSAPSSAGAELQDITETARVNMAGTAAAIRATVNNIELLFDAARRRNNGGEGAKAYVNYRPVDTDSTTYRSEVLDGRVEWSANPGLRRLGETEPFIQVAVIWTRRWAWELPTEQDAGTVHITNGDVAGGLDVGGWLGPIAPPTYGAALGPAEGDNAFNAGEWTNIAGVLPTPAHLTVTNESGGNITLKRVYIANDVYARFDGAQHQLGSGAAVSWTVSSDHATARWTLTPTSAQIAKLVAGGGVRLLAVMTGVQAGVYLRAQLQQATGGAALTAWTGPEAYTESGRLVYDLGYVQMPPGVTTFANWRIVVTIFSTSAGDATLDFLQLCPGRELVVLESAGVAWADGAALDWWGDERYAAVGGLHASLRGVGRLLLQPRQPNRLMVLAESTTGVNAAAKLALRVRYRPRRPTV